MQFDEPLDYLGRLCPGTLNLDRDQFSPDEELYRRVSAGKLKQGKPRSECFKNAFPISFNRSRYSGIECTRCERPNNFRQKSKTGPVIRLRIGDIWACNEKLKGSLVDGIRGVTIDHEPTWKNYSHSEIRVDIDPHSHPDPLAVRAFENDLAEELSRVGAADSVPSLPSDCRRCYTDPLCLRRLDRLNGPESRDRSSLERASSCNETCELGPKCYPSR
jgi:hypothetical protein